MFCCTICNVPASIRKPPMCAFIQCSAAGLIPVPGQHSFVVGVPMYPLIGPKTGELAYPALS